MTDLEIFPTPPIEISIAESEPRINIELVAQTGFVITVDELPEPRVTVQLSEQETTSLQLSYQFPPSLQFVNPHLSAEVDQPVLPGQPLYLKANGHLGLAKADNALTAEVHGFASYPATEAGQSVTYTVDDWVERTDWSEIADTTHLVPGTTYYLSRETEGKITTVPPSQDGEISAVVGYANDDRRLIIEIQPVIFL